MLEGLDKLKLASAAFAERIYFQQKGRCHGAHSGYSSRDQTVSPAQLLAPNLHGRPSLKLARTVRLHRHKPRAPALGPQEIAQLADFEVETDFLYLPSWTPDQLAGLAFGAFMLACFYLTRNFDEWIAQQQREELGLCPKCGGIYDPSLCKEGKCPMK
eukprot:scaffold68895_cov35-Prasinocladus_malaysianus.AAC.1